jgi:hypothetical protein
VESDLDELRGEEMHCLFRLRLKEEFNACESVRQIHITRFPTTILVSGLQSGRKKRKDEENE